MPTEERIDAAVATPITEIIDADLVQEILSRPPFVHVPGTFNFRDLATSSSSALRAGYVFRSGTLENLNPQCGEALRELGIKKIFDLRSRNERKEAPGPFVDGVTGVWVPSTLDDETREMGRVGDVGIQSMYLDLLETHQRAIKMVLQHILDRPDEPFLFHCTAGKDRTGVLAALILSLAGVPLGDIQRDYALTRIGVEPVREFLLQKMAGRGREVNLEDPSVKAAGGFPEDAMEKLIEGIGERYGVVEGFVRDVLGFERGEVETIRKNLRRDES